MCSDSSRAFKIIIQLLFSSVLLKSCFSLNFCTILTCSSTLLAFERDWFPGPVLGANRWRSLTDSVPALWRHYAQRSHCVAVLVTSTRLVSSEQARKALGCFPNSILIWRTYQSVMKLLKLLRSSYHTARDRLGLNILEWNLHPLGRLLSTECKEFPQNFSYIQHHVRWQGTSARLNQTCDNVLAVNSKNLLH